MGIKDKLKRTSRVFMSDPKQDMSEKGAAAGGEIEATTASGSADAGATSPEGVTNAPADNADGTLASSGAQDEAAVHDESAEGAPSSAGDATSGDKTTENGAVKRTSLFKRIRNKARRSADGEPKRTEFFLKLLQKFRKPVGVLPAAAMSEEKRAEDAADATAAHRLLLDPATESAAEAPVEADAALVAEPAVEAAK